MKIFVGINTFSFTNVKTTLEIMIESELSLYESGEKKTNVSTQFNPSILEKSLKYLKTIDQFVLHDILKQLSVINYKDSSGGLPRTIRATKRINDITAIQYARSITNYYDVELEDGLQNYLDSQY